MQYTSRIRKKVDTYWHVFICISFHECFTRQNYFILKLNRNIKVMKRKKIVYEIKFMKDDVVNIIVKKNIITSSIEMKKIIK